MRGRLALFVFLACFFSSSTEAQVFDGNTGSRIRNAQTCMAPHGMTGGMVEVFQQIGPSMYWAHANYAPNGMPFITYGPIYFSLPDYMQVFTSVHECGHLSQMTTDEFAANCYAIEQLGLSDFELVAVGNFHRAVGPLPPQYGGSGENFWLGTLQYCGL